MYIHHLLVKILYIIERLPIEILFHILTKKGFRMERELIIQLKSHLQTPIFDHTFISPTYKEPIRRHINNYIESAGKKL